MCRRLGGTQTRSEALEVDSNHICICDIHRKRILVDVILKEDYVNSIVQVKSVSLDAS